MADSSPQAVAKSYNDSGYSLRALYRLNEKVPVVCYNLVKYFHHGPRLALNPIAELGGSRS